MTALRIHPLVPLSCADDSLNGVPQLARVVADAVFENGFDPLDVGNQLLGIAADDDQIGAFSLRDGSRYSCTSRTPSVRAAGPG